MQLLSRRSSESIFFYQVKYSLRVNLSAVAGQLQCHWRVLSIVRRCGQAGIYLPKSHSLQGHCCWRTCIFYFCYSLYTRYHHITIHKHHISMSIPLRASLHEEGNSAAIHLADLHSKLRNIKHLFYLHQHRSQSLHLAKVHTMKYFLGAIIHLHRQANQKSSIRLPGSGYSTLETYIHQAHILRHHQRLTCHRHANFNTRHIEHFWIINISPVIPPEQGSNFIRQTHTSANIHMNKLTKRLNKKTLLNYQKSWRSNSIHT